MSAADKPTHSDSTDADAAPASQAAATAEAAGGETQPEPGAAESPADDSETPVLPSPLSEPAHPTNQRPLASPPNVQALDDGWTDPPSTPNAAGAPQPHPPQEATELPADFAAQAFPDGQPPEVFQPDDPEAPPLPYSEAEPNPPKTFAGSGAPPLHTLERLAGPSAHPERAREHLRAALSGGSYDPRAVPESKHIALGLARVVVAHGVALDDVVDAILEAMQE